MSAETTQDARRWARGRTARGAAAATTRFGAFTFGSKTGPVLPRQHRVSVLQCQLEDRCDRELPKAVVYETGANSGARFDPWPPKARDARIALSRTRRAAVVHRARGTRRRWTATSSDPAKPVPYTRPMSFGYYRQYPLEDQRFAASRPDVLVYETEPLTNDLTLAGPIGVDAANRDDGHRRGLHREGDRRLPGRCADPPMPRLRREAAGRLSATREGRRVSRAVARSLREARAARAGPSRDRSTTSCRTSFTRSRRDTG